MSKQEKRIISEVIRRFYHDRYSEGEDGQIYNKFIRWLLRNEDSEEVERELVKFWEEQKIKPEKAMLKALEESRRRRGSIDSGRKMRVVEKMSFSRVVPRVAAVLVPVMVMLGVVYYYNQQEPAVIEDVYTELVVPNAENQKIILADGTEVWINSDSKLTYPETMNGDERVVELSGESFFKVAKNEEKPFVVRTKFLSITVLGTEFNVNAYSGGEITSVTLNSGKVNIGVNNDQKIDLKPGEQLVYDNITGNFEIRYLDKLTLDETSGWRDGRLILENISLTEMLESIRRHYNVEVIVEDQVVFAGKYSAKFIPGESLENVMEVISGIVPGLNYRIDDNRLIISRIN